ncbi:SGNH/GDSL hydrolase family protein [Microvirga sp. 2TAF3]|uniref:SGNH/GDSL hydrolase family protein n=1 Tax=Microvirga sp. 2TAF3 TaxID=3233014 RepID=UPI003F97826B
MSAQPNPFAPHWLIRDIVIGSHIHAAGPGSVLFIGDSIVEGFYWNRIGACPVVNAGYSGIWTEALLPKVPRLLETAKPRLAVLLVGTNDAKKGKTEPELDEVATYCDRIVRLSGETGVPLIVMTPPPVETGKRLTSFYSVEAMASLSRRIVRIAERHGAGVIDMHTAFSGAGHEAQEGFTTDGIHLSPQAYRRMHDMLTRKITEMMDRVQGA